MTRIALFALIVALAGCASGTAVSPRTERQFQVDWQVISEPRGPVVRGQLRNPYGPPARDIRLLVEGLDASGGVMSTTTSVVRQIIRSGERAAFDVPVADGADRYRVTVVAFDLILPRGSR